MIQTFYVKQKLCERAQAWFCENNLLLNSDKTQKLLISSCDRSEDINSVCVLGITIDNKLNWSVHIDCLSKKLATSIFALRRLSNSLSIDALRISYFALFHSKMIYEITLWGGSTNALKIFRLQKKAIRVIMHMGPKESCRNTFSFLGIMTLPAAFIFNTLLEIHQNKSLYPTVGDSGVNTRTSNNLKLPRYRLAKSLKNSRNLNLYNRLPTTLRALDIERFKISIKEILTKKSFYTVNEFLDYNF